MHLPTLFVAASAFVTALAAPATEPVASNNDIGVSLFERASLFERTDTGNGINGGFYYSFYNAGGGTVDFENKAAGEYSVTWKNCNNFVAGKGWATGSARAIKFSGTYTPGGNSYLSVYGWSSADPLVEYYIVEDYGAYKPGGYLTHMGTVTSDGSVYDILSGTVHDLPSIKGTATFQQYWSVRRDTRTSGTVTTGNHFDAWAKLGMKLGTLDYQIVATEGYMSSGSSDITVY